MNDVVSGAPDRQSVLVTGFGPFPSVPKNPTAEIVARLDEMRTSFERIGIDLATAVLPVVYAEMDAALRVATGGRRFDAILHLGVATRRRTICVEMCARNQVSALLVDASGATAASPALANDGPPTLVTTYAAHEIVAAIRRQGHPVRVSRDAGVYLCNARLYRSLHARLARQVGFIHVPLPTDDRPKSGSGGPSISDLTDAVVAALLVMTQRPPVALGSSSPTARTTGVAPAGP